MEYSSIMNRIFQLFRLPLIILYGLTGCNAIWMSPISYPSKEQKELQPPVMSLDIYTQSGLIDSHPRPYIYKIESKNAKGAVLVFGADHTKDPTDQQLPLIENEWNNFNPTVALVEGRLGFLFSWTQDPVKTYGESGFVAGLAKSNGVKLYSWEPDRDQEIEMLLNSFDPAHIAAFYCLRPFRGNYSGLSFDESNEVMKSLIAERTNRKGIKGFINSVEQIDSLWKFNHPDLGDWRTYQHPRNGWPEGKFKQIAEESNSIRDAFMCKSIIELVTNGERVFITMGSSHAPRIENTLRKNLGY